MPEDCVNVPNCFMVLRDLRMSMFKDIQLLKDVADLKPATVLVRRCDGISCIVGLKGPILKCYVYDDASVGLLYLFGFCMACASLSIEIEASPTQLFSLQPSDGRLNLDHQGRP